uniref:RAB4A, member RAS onco family n=1 Tax=Canis lupus familiaris TaxID=9615 RepID=A0A8C0N1E6_CANLF
KSLPAFELLRTTTRPAAESHPGGAVFPPQALGRPCPGAGSRRPLRSVTPRLPTAGPSSATRLWPAAPLQPRPHPAPRPEAPAPPPGLRDPRTRRELRAHALPWRGPGLTPSPPPAPPPPPPPRGRRPARRGAGAGAGAGAVRLRGAGSPAGPQPRGGRRLPWGRRAPPCSGPRPEPIPPRRRGRPRPSPPARGAGAAAGGPGERRCRSQDVADGHVRNLRSVTRSYYRGAAGALLVYDITSRETYNALTNWLTDARMLASQNIVIILCGNKKDLDADREVTFLEASRFAQENELMFLETSALTGENVEEAFVQCARKILNKIESGELDPERMGSGIQYGDAALRQLRSPRRAQAPSAQECGC